MYNLKIPLAEINKKKNPNYVVIMLHTYCETFRLLDKIHMDIILLSASIVIYFILIILFYQFLIHFILDKR